MEYLPLSKMTEPRGQTIATPERMNARQCGQVQYLRRRRTDKVVNFFIHFCTPQI
ncbi:MAG: hypothetical protein IPL47_12295 [Phyllobacteriaceae bacterium]|nr:hypothetical protein [Phyllobacteriaceae bacterium]